MQGGHARGTYVPLKPQGGHASPLNPPARWMRSGVAGGACRPLVGFTGMAQRKRARLITVRSQDQNLLPVFFFRPPKGTCVHLKPQGGRMSPLNPSVRWMRGGCAVDAQWGCRGCLSPPGGVAGGACRPLVGCLSPPGRIHRHGAEEARTAHNREVTGSKPVAGIFFQTTQRDMCPP